MSFIIKIASYSCVRMPEPVLEAPNFPDLQDLSRRIKLA